MHSLKTGAPNSRENGCENKVKTPSWPQISPSGGDRVQGFQMTDALLDNWAKNKLDKGYMDTPFSKNHNKTVNITILLSVIKSCLALPDRRIFSTAGPFDLWFGCVHIEPTLTPVS